MNGTNVSSLDATDQPADQPAELLSQMSRQLNQLTPQERKAASYVLENPTSIGVSSIRELANAAGVKPNTFVRMARSLGFDGYDEFRQPFREEIRRGSLNFPDRARWLQSLGQGGKLPGLFADMASSAIDNIENTFASIDFRELKKAADQIVSAQRTYVLGVGVYHSLANNFAYLAGMAVENVHAIPRPGNHLLDDLARAGSNDVIVAMTFKPYRSEVVQAVQVAAQQGARIIGISDSAAAPFAPDCQHLFVTASDTPQFFPSTVATVALLETLMAFVIADADPDIIKSIERFHQRRHNLGIYVSP